MNVSDLYEIFYLEPRADYSLAEQTMGFVVPGEKPKASLNMPESAKYVALLQYRQGELRANHYHKNKTEYLVIVDGSLSIALTSVEHSEQSITLDLSSGAAIRIDPLCHHKLTAISETATAIELSPEQLDLSDTYDLP